jgi:opacity protein-like surface antigen
MEIKACLTSALTILILPAIAAAQEGASVGGNVSALNMDSNTSVSYSAAFDYRFTRVVGLELDATFAPSLKSPFPGAIIQNASVSSGLPGSVIGSILPLPSLSNQKGGAVIFSNNVRVAIPTTTSRLEPFFVAGGGVAGVRHTADLRYTFPPILGARDIPSFSNQLTSSSLGLALTLGGGLGIKTTSHLWIDADLRLIRILGTDDENVGRFGVGVRYRF